MSKAQENFQKNILPQLQQKFNLSNPMAVPRLEKIVVNVGIGKSKESPQFKEFVVDGLAIITGQKPKVTRAKKAISGFKIRKDDEVGLAVTLRGRRMYDFALKLANIVLPRMRDFRGLNTKGFDRDGNFTLTITEQIIFPEISHEKAETLYGMSITIVTTAKDKEQGQILLEALGFPFAKKQK